MNARAVQLEKTRGESKSGLVWAGLAAVVLVAVAAFGAKFCLEHGLMWRCPSILIFGLPCPGCGSTRAFAALAEFDFLGALRFNPLLVLGMVAAGLAVLGKLNWDNWSRRTWTIVGVLFLVNWVYLLLFLPR